MPFTKDHTEESKKRILDVAKRHFSENGFDGTRVDDIARDAGVNKALIYYYFKNKEAILDHLIKSLFDDIRAITMEFVRNSIVAMVNDGKLDVKGDELSFASQKDADEFHETGLRYMETLVDFLLSHRSLVRILIFESLKNSKHHNDLFLMLGVLRDKDGDLHEGAIADAPGEFAFSADQIISRFFFGFVPLFNFAAYYDDYVAASSMSEAALCESFLKAYAKSTNVGRFIV